MTLNDLEWLSKIFSSRSER